MPEQISPLRQRMIDDMSLRNMSALTQAAYIRAVKNFSKHFGRPPSGLRPSTFVMSDTPVEVQFTSDGCLNYPCRTPRVCRR
jgi:hypothetical protein